MLGQTILARSVSKLEVQFEFFYVDFALPKLVMSDETAEAACALGAGPTGVWLRLQQRPQ